MLGLALCGGVAAVAAATGSSLLTALGTLAAILLAGVMLLAGLTILLPALILAACVALWFLPGLLAAFTPAERLKSLTANVTRAVQDAIHSSPVAQRFFLLSESESVSVTLEELETVQVIGALMPEYEFECVIRVRLEGGREFDGVAKVVGNGLSVLATGTAMRVSALVLQLPGGEMLNLLPEAV